jgi:citrate synthase
MGFPTDTYPVLFALPLLAGWLAHWIEAMNNPSKIAPKQFYRGRGTRGFVELSERKENNFDIACSSTTNNRRR